MAAPLIVCIDSRARLGALCALLLAAGLTSSASAEESVADASGAVSPQAFVLHGQLTYTEQEVSGFTAPYSGPHSLTPHRGKETTDATLFLGFKLWSGAEAWINPEADQGFGLNNTLGVAGFPSGEAYKVGKSQPYFRLSRAFIRDTVSLAGDREVIDASGNWMAGEHSVNRWVFTVGKFGVADIFDANQYAHDPRGDFLNWSAVDTGSFDYAADAWGYTVGAAAEWYQNAWTLRLGAFDLSDVPNSVHLEPGFHEFQIILEAEHRHALFGQPGKLMVTAFDSRGRMGLLDQAVQLALSSGNPIDISAVRHYRSRLGVHLNVEQALSANLGFFARVGKAAGNVETYEFSDIDRSIEAGLSLKGAPWRRAHDTLGLAFIDNGISASRERYLNAGGLGVLIGDGQLPHPGPEQIVETYYSAAVFSHAAISLDYQWINNPAYNRDRGPVSVYAVRMHAQF